MPPPKSPSKLPSKGLNFLKARLNKRRYSNSPEQGRTPSRSASPLRQQETTASIDAQFVENLLQGGKHVPRFQKRMPSIRTAFRKYESMTFRQRFMGLPDEVRDKVYDYVIARETHDDWNVSEHCQAGFVDCSRGVISLEAGDPADVLYLDEVCLTKSFYFGLHTYILHRSQSYSRVGLMACPLSLHTHLTRHVLHHRTATVPAPVDHYIHTPLLLPPEEDSLDTNRGCNHLPKIKYCASTTSIQSPQPGPNMCEKVTESGSNFFSAGVATKTQEYTTKPHSTSALSKTPP